MTIVDRYASTNEFLNDLNAIQNFNSEHALFFLLGCIKRIKECSFDEYKKVIDYLLMSEQFKFFVPWLAIQACVENKEFSYLCEIIDNNKNLNYYSLAVIAHKKRSEIFSNGNFEQILDCLILNEHLDVVKECLKLEASFSSRIAEKYIPTLLNIMTVLSEGGSYHQEQLLKAIFLSDYGKNNIFDAVCHQIEPERFISLRQYSNLYTTLKALIIENTKIFIEKFIENNFLKSRISFVGDLNRVLYHADAKEVLAWIGDDQDRIEYWAENSQFSKVPRDLGDSKVISWNNIVADLLNRTTNPSKIIDSVFENSIVNMSGWTGSQSQEMRSRLDTIESFKSYLEVNNLKKYITYVEVKRNEWSEAIGAQEFREVEREKRDEGFDY